MTNHEIGTMVVESAIAVHRELGPGLLETVYEIIFGEALMKNGITCCVHSLEEGSSLRSARMACASHDRRIHAT